MNRRRKDERGGAFGCARHERGERVTELVRRPGGGLVALPEAIGRVHQVAVRVDVLQGMQQRRLPGGEQRNDEERAGEPG